MGTPSRWSNGPLPLLNTPWRARKGRFRHFFLLILIKILNLVVPAAYLSIKSYFLSKSVKILLNSAGFSSINQWPTSFILL